MDFQSLNFRTIQTDVSYTSFKCIVKTYIRNNNMTIIRLNL